MSDRSSVADAVAALEAQDDDGVEARLAQLRRRNDSLSRELARVLAREEELVARLHLVQSIADLSPTPPKWLAPKKTRSGNRATVCTVLSDLHLDEVVDPAQVGGVNAYDRDIATLRLHRFFDRVVTLSRDYLSGVTYDGCVLFLGGDLLSGDIHEELVATNEDTTPGSILFWLEHLAAGVAMLADEFGRLHVPSVAGNHGRRTRKPRAKGRARDNFDWLLSSLLAREFRDDDRVTFDVPDSFSTTVQVYDATFRLEHGDQARGGSGWMGVLGPAMRRDAKVRAQADAMQQPYDHLVIGHWHRLSWLPGVVVNGSTKGLDEYAAIEGFGFEPPQQAMWLSTAKHGVTMQAPVLVADRAKEGW